MHFRRSNTIKSLIMAPRGKGIITRKSTAIYRYMCNGLEHDEKYTGESIRIFGERIKEYLRAPCPIYDHTNISGHHTKLDNFSIVDR